MFECGEKRGKGKKRISNTKPSSRGAHHQ
jgi:hypothetical protein